MYLIIPIFGSLAFLAVYLVGRQRNKTAWRPVDSVLVVWGLLYTLVFILTIGMGEVASEQVPSPFSLLVAAACWVGLPGACTAGLLKSATETKFLVNGTLVATLIAWLAMMLPLEGLQPFVGVLLWNSGVAVAVLVRPWNNADPVSIVMRRSGNCQSCGYDLTGNVTGVCPECGAPRRTTARESTGL